MKFRTLCFAFWEGKDYNSERRCVRNVFGLPKKICWVLDRKDSKKKKSEAGRTNKYSLFLNP